MRDDFAVFILTHGRAENMVTLKMLQKLRYTGKWYMIIDNEDDQEKLYFAKYGKDHVIKFDKQEIANRIDTMDNFNDHRAILYARCKSFEIAKDLGLSFFLMLDDDFESIDFRWAEDDKLKAKSLFNLDKAFEAMIQFLIDSNADTVCFGQGGDLIGGLNGRNFKKECLRKGMNSFFCRADRSIDYRGTMNEDVVAYTTLTSRGHLFLTYSHVSVIQLPTQSLAGGMTEAYLEGGTYLKSFYAVMSMPSAVKVDVLNTTHKRIHHKVTWNKCAPKILNQKYKKVNNE